MTSAFRVRVPGKWVLAGEHSVLRGGTAVALPHPEFGLTLEFIPGGRGLAIVPVSATGVIAELLGSIRDEWERTDRVFPSFDGTLQIASTIPIGAGLGSSAALCVAVTRWLSEPLRIPAEEILDFATRLEHRFHGRSSGMDIAVIASGAPVSFVMGGGPRPLGIRNLPNFTFHDTGLRSRTSDCVAKVEELRATDPARALRIDEAMGAASRLAMEGLVRFDSGDSPGGLEILIQSLRQSQECFFSWGLVPPEAQELERKLRNEGALAVKLTGAGGGGICVALWEKRLT